MMNVLVCIPTLGRTTLELFAVDESLETRRVVERGVHYTPDEVAAAMQSLATRGVAIHLALFYGPVGPANQPGPMLANDEVLLQIEDEEFRAPTTLPAVRAALRAFRESYPMIPSVFHHGSGFFAGLPACERTYAIEPAEGRRLGLDRVGFQGLFHAATVAGMHHARLREQHVPVRTLSICLEPTVEAAAIVNDRPVMVTGGVTPLEGLPGQTTCGEIDPGMVLILAQEHHWSPEQIAEALTRESGLLGLVGRPITLSELFASNDEPTRLAREMMLYRLLLVSGMAVGVMGGIDRIVFSGRHAQAGEVIGPWLRERLGRLPGGMPPRLEWMYRPMVELLLEEALRLHEELIRDREVCGAIPAN
jgi:acetate kinase